MLSVLLFGELEARRHGFEPSVKDGPELWAAYRARANTPAGPTAPLVLIGTSRFMLGINPAILSDVIGRPVIDLAIDGSWPFEVLENLASDANFHGFVLCEVDGFLGNAEVADPNGFVKPRAYLKYFHQRTSISDAEALLRESVQSRVTLLLPELSLRPLVSGVLFRHGTVGPSYVRMIPGRFRPADYTIVDLAAHRKHWEEAFATNAPPATAEEIIRFAALLGDATRRIRVRGGNVIFMRMLSSGGVRAVEERQSPRKDWDLFASRVGGVSFHYEDVPTLRTFEAPDGSHLDRRQADEFSRALGAELLRRPPFGAGQQ